MPLPIDARNGPEALQVRSARTKYRGQVNGPLMCRYESLPQMKPIKGVHKDDLRLSGELTLTGQSPFNPKLKPSIPHRSALRCSLFLERPTPCAWTYANNAGEESREMTLIVEAALRCHIGERQPVIAQLFLG